MLHNSNFILFWHYFLTCIDFIAIIPYASSYYPHSSPLLHLISILSPIHCHLQYFQSTPNLDKNMKKNRQADDIDYERTRAQSMMPDISKSFQIGSSKKFTNITLPDVQIKNKDQYKKQPYCMICYRNFTTTFRQHHCRICANATCGDCSRSMVNKERSCDLCIMRLSIPHEDKKKKEVLETLQTLCAFLLYRKKMKMNELEQLKNSEGTESEQYQKQLIKQEQQIVELQEENKRLKMKQKQTFEELDKIRTGNQKIEDQISQISASIPNFQEDY